MVDTAPLLEVKNIVVSFSAGKAGSARAVDDVSFVIPRGGVVGLVGESGCGKTTLGRAITGFQPFDSGSVLLDGANLAGLPRKELRKQRRRIQMIFQNPFASLDPRMTITDAITEAFPSGKFKFRGKRIEAVAAALLQVGLDTSTGSKFPHEFSGGQRQRIAIARALAAGPDLLIADEPVSSLDVSVAAQVLNLLKDIHTRLHFSMLFISHDLSVVRYISDFLLVMYRGRIVESGPAGELFATPLHPYTTTLLEAVPEIENAAATPFFEKISPASDAVPISGGCVFAHRCGFVMGQCRMQVPALSTVTAQGTNRQCACFKVGK